jgi:predicted porin
MPRSGLPHFELRGEISIMQKKLIAIAVAGLGTFAGAAQADDSTLTMYGLLDAGIASYSHVGPTSQTASGVQSGAFVPNLWGMKGSENLGNGTKAVFAIEGSVNLNNGAIGANSNGNLFGREANIGLDNPSWGTLKVGLFIDPYLIAVLITDPNDLVEAGSALNTYVYSQGISQLNNSVIGIFDPNAVYYQTPEIGGVFNATGVYGFGGVAGNQSALRYFSGNMVYHTGPFLADFAYFDMNDAKGQNLDKSWHLGGSYKLNDAFKFYLAYDDSKTPQGLNTTFGLNSANVFQNTQWGLGFAGNITPNVGYSVGYYRETDKNNSGDKATTLGVEMTYKLSKRTKLYAIVDQLKAGSDGMGGGIMNGYANTSAPGGGLVFPGQSSTGFSLGMTHSF